MPAPRFLADLLGFRLTKDGVRTAFVNICDSANKASCEVSSAILRQIVVGAPRCVPDSEGTGARFEQAVRAYMRVELSRLASHRQWTVGSMLIDRFEQYEHLRRLEQLVKGDATRVLRAAVGGDYLIEPDVTVGVPGTRGGLLLHAAVSCKWTLRSDRAQNVRHEAVVMIRHRRGPLPHIVGITMEPLPQRIAALARGTGEIDAVYHPAYHELIAAVETLGPKHREQKDTLEELIQHHRLFPLEVLGPTLTS